MCDYVFVLNIVLTSSLVLGTKVPSQRLVVHPMPCRTGLSLSKSRCANQIAASSAPVSVLCTRIATGEWIILVCNPSSRLPMTSHTPAEQLGSCALQQMLGALFQVHDRNPNQPMSIACQSPAANWSQLRIVPGMVMPHSRGC